MKQIHSRSLEARPLGRATASLRRQVILHHCDADPGIQIEIDAPKQEAS